MKRYLIIAALLVSAILLTLGSTRLEGRCFTDPFGNLYWIEGNDVDGKPIAPPPDFHAIPKG